MEGDRNEFLEHVAGVFRDISLLEIRKAYRVLYELAPRIIENFVEKYSDFVIFLLNILDQKRSNELLSKLTDSSLVYIVEEELRTLLIREVASIARAGGDFTDLSLFLDLNDRAGVDETRFEATRRVLAVAGAIRQRSGRRAFGALDNIPEERCLRVLHLVGDRNVSVAIGVMFYASDRTLALALDELADRQPRLLTSIPEEWFLVRFRSGHARYLREDVFALLPEGIRQRLERLAQFWKQEESAIRHIRAERADSKDEQEARRRSLDTICGLVQRAESDALELILQSFVQEGLLRLEDCDLIRTVAKR